MPSRLPGGFSSAAVMCLCLLAGRETAAGTPFLTDDAPLAALARAFGYRLESDLRTSRLRLVSAEHEIVLALGLPRALVDGAGMPLLEAPRCSGGQVVVGPDLADVIRRLAPLGPESAGHPPRERPEPGSRPRLSGPAGAERPARVVLADLASSLLGAHSTRDDPGPCGPRRRAQPSFVIDPGHGGHDDGARGRNGTKEKDVVLDIAKRLARELRDGGARVVLTREDDRFVDLRTRAELASREKADAFLSLHANSHPDQCVSGVETWIPRRGASHWAKSQELGRSVQAALVRETRERDRGVREGSYTVLVESKVPAVLAELGFLSNPATEKALTDPARCDSLARALAEALLAAMGRKP